MYWSRDGWPTFLLEGLQDFDRRDQADLVFGTPTPDLQERLLERPMLDRFDRDDQRPPCLKLGGGPATTPPARLSPRMDELDILGGVPLGTLPPEATIRPGVVG